MAYELTVGGYTFENPPEEYRKLARLSNSPQTAFNRKSTAFYQSDSQDLQFQVDGTLALDPALGGSDDLQELEKLQEIAIQGGEVAVEFNPFFTGKCVIEDDPFRQEDGESTYSFTFTVNSESTDNSAYPAHSAPDTGNTFEFGDLDLGYDPNQVTQNYERQNEKVKRIQGIARTVDTEGLIPKVTISGMIDGGGQATLWEKARSNTLAYLSAEFQNGWVLVDSLSIRNTPEAPDYLTGMFQYDMDLLVVMDPGSGIGEVSKFVDRDVQDQSTYVSNCDEDGLFERLGDDSEDYPEALDYRVSGGTGKLDGDYVEWPEDFGTLDQNTTIYIWVEDGDGDGYGQVNTGTSGFPGNTVSLFEVDTGTSSVNDIRDQRSCLTGTRLEDDELGDLNFTDTLSLDDQLAYERLLALSDQMSLTESGLLPASGFATLDPETVTQPSLSEFYQGIGSFTDFPDLIDGGSASSGGAGGPSVSDEKQFWKKALDWDRAVSEKFASHPDGVVTSGAFLDGFEDGSLSEWTNLASKVTTTTTYAYNGSYSIYTGDYTGGTSINRFATLIPDGYSGGSQPDEISFYYRETGNSTGGGLRFLNSNGNEEFGMATDNPEWDLSDANSSSGTLRQVFNPSSDEYGKWVYVRMYNLDWSAGTFDVLIQDTTGSYPDYTETGIPMRNGVDIEKVEIWEQNAESWDDGTGEIEMWFDDIKLISSSSSLTTETKSFTQETEPDLAELDYTLNGDSITLDVIGSPGTASEEINSVTLDGATSYGITWNSSHQDFRVKMNFTGTDPTLNIITLIGETGGAGGNQLVGWGSEFDWDYRTSEARVDHPNDRLFMGIGTDNFDSYSTGSTPPSPWNVVDSNGIVSGTRGYSDGQSWEFTANTSDPSNGVSTMAYSEGFSANKYDEFTFIYWENPNNTGAAMRVLDSSGREVAAAGTDNPEVVSNDGSSLVQHLGSVTPDYQEWRRFTLSFDWDAKTYDLLWEDLTGSTDDLKIEGLGFYNTNATDIARVEVTRDDRDDFGVGADTEIWFDDVAGLSPNIGDLTTEFKYMSEPIVPGQVELKDLLYNLNGGGIDVYVESDTDGDGTVDETSDPVTLDGGTVFDVTGLTSESDRFRLRFEFTGSGSSPDLDSVTLAGTAGSSDPDQNPQTTWEIRGAKYDTSGNEYEGGGMVSRYGG
jgi:hypothetical protein